MTQQLRYSGSANLPINRREFLSSSLLGAAALCIGGCKSMDWARSESIIDIHQHAGYSGRTDEELLAHQARMGVTRTILLPSGRPMSTASTHQGVANGLQASALGNEVCYRLAQRYPRLFYFAANEVPDAPDAEQAIERYLKLGAVAIAEQKFGIECDAPQMQRLYRMAADYRVPILIHWQHGMYNYGFERFYKMLERHPNTLFIGHAQTWWANIDKNHTNPASLYPTGKVVAGGLTDRYLADYPNIYGDLSAGSGLNALKRDEDHARAFLDRHQDKLLYGSDCNDREGAGAKCQGWQTIQTLRRLVTEETALRKIFAGNARKVFRL